MVVKLNFFFLLSLQQVTTTKLVWFPSHSTIQSKKTFNFIRRTLVKIIYCWMHTFKHKKNVSISLCPTSDTSESSIKGGQEVQDTLAGVCWVSQGFSCSV